MQSRKIASRTLRVMSAALVHRTKRYDIRVDQPSAFEQLTIRFGLEFEHIKAARIRTQTVRQSLSALNEYSSADTSIVVYGSIGRAEVIEGSDADWTLLIDGPSDPGHLRVSQEVEKKFRELGLKKPGREGTFGGLVSSHELIHHMAGSHDTNQNLTRRILLLLESYGVTEPLVRQRVLGNILNRYILYDTTVPRSDPPKDVIPHFLLNDVVRYWRTMASDYAAKMWERDAEEWAIRNVKLRFSRKLIFIAGLLTCFSFELEPPANRGELIADRERLPEILTSHILDTLGTTPLDVVSRRLLHLDARATARKFFGAYDDFLAILGDVEKRATLMTLRLQDAISSKVWNEARAASHRFREAIETLFFSEDQRLHELTRSYGVF
jgi:hypothetical protein